MTIINSREDILKHETLEYIQSRPKWELGAGRIPDLSDYRKLSVDNMDEAMTLARLGQIVGQQFLPKIHSKPLKLYFTQALVLGSSLITRSMAKKYGLDFEKYRSVLLICPSRWGKSFINALSIIIHAAANGEECQIGAATMPKAQIIQGKVVEMLPDTVEEIQSGLIIDGQEEDKFKKIKRLSTQVSKDSLKWTNGGSIGLFSTNESRKNADVQAAGAIGIGGDFCVDGACEVLTKVGWKKLAELSDFTEVAQYTKEGKIEFVMPSRVIRKHYQGQGYKVSFTNGAKDVFMIPQHRQPLLNRNRQLVIREIQDVNFSDYWSTILAGEGVGEDILTPYERLIIACQADGCILKTTERGNYFQIKVKKKRKADRLERLFYEANMPVKIHRDSRGYYVCHFYMIFQCDKVLSHAFGWNVSGKKGRQILEELVQWDGYKYKDGTIYYSSTDEGNVEWVQAIAAQSGYRAHKSKQEDHRSKAFNTIHRIHCKPTPTRSARSCWKKPVEWNDMVYCVTVPSGMFLLRKGDLTITGNCVFDEVQLMTPVGFRTASRFMVESPDTKRFCVGNPMINGHFKELYDDPKTFVVHINEVTAIIEERMTRRGIELTGMPTYSQEYRAFVETEFPDARSGTRFFSTLPNLLDASKMPTPIHKFYFLGIDSAYKGGDSLTVSLLSFNQASEKTWFALESQANLKERFRGEWDERTTLEICLDIMKVWEQYNVVAGAIDIGFGIHIYEKLRDLYPGIPLEPINYASKPTDWRADTDYNAQFALNKRAELHLDLRDLASNDLLYIAPDCYEEILREMGEVSQAPAKQKIQIEPKKDIKARLGRSPDDMDSLCLAIHAAVLSGVLGGGSEVNANNIMEVVA